VRVSTLLAVAGVEARARMSYRVDFWVQAVLVFAVQLGVVWAVWTAVFAESGATTIGGYARTGMIVYGAAAALASRLVMGTEMETGVGVDVYEGTLSRYLLYPAPYPAVKYAQHVGSLAPIAVQLVLFGAVLPLLVQPEGVHVGPASLAMGVVSLAVANLLWWTMVLPLHGVAFWAENVWSLLLGARFVSHLLGGMLVPLSVFPAWAQPALAAMPFHHAFGDPVETLLGRVDPATWAKGLGVALLWTAGFAAVGAWVLRRGRRAYTGAGVG
jgi:ABC-2 type transport system permease protein